MWIYLKFGSVFNRILCACMQIKWAQKNQPTLTELENNSEREIVCLFVYILWLFDSCWFLRAFLCCLWHCEPQRWSFSFYIFAKFAVNICAVTYAECWWAGKLIAGAYTTTNSHVNLCIFANLDARCHCSQHVIKTCQFRIYYVFHVCQTPHDAMHFDNNNNKKQCHIFSRPSCTMDEEHTCGAQYTFHSQKKRTFRFTTISIDLIWKILKWLNDSKIDSSKTQTHTFDKLCYEDKTNKITEQVTLLVGAVYCYFFCCLFFLSLDI